MPINPRQFHHGRELHGICIHASYVEAQRAFGGVVFHRWGRCCTEHDRHVVRHRSRCRGRYRCRPERQRSAADGTHRCTGALQLRRVAGGALQRQRAARRPCHRAAGQRPVARGQWYRSEFRRTWPGHHAGRGQRHRSEPAEDRCDPHGLQVRHHLRTTGCAAAGPKCRGHRSAGPGRGRRQR
ncbi:hypothetical protein D3C73_881570 [compost metagenome]